MIRPAVISVVLAASTLLATVAARSAQVEEAPERTPTELAQPDAEVVVANCSGCHSLDYISTQPRHKGPQFWTDEVNKMVNVYKAPIAPEDATAISAVLARKYG